MSNKTKKQLEAELKQVRADLDAANKTLSENDEKLNREIARSVDITAKLKHFSLAAEALNADKALLEREIKELKSRLQSMLDNESNLLLSSEGQLREVRELLKKERSSHVETCDKLNDSDKLNKKYIIENADLQVKINIYQALLLFAATACTCAFWVLS